MGYETILLAQEDIATITLNRPKVMNCLNSTMRRKIPAALTEVSASARVIVLTGAGRGFCAGQDLNDAKGLEDIEFDRTLREEYEPMLHAIYQCPVPTIGAVNRPAARAGTNLALAADVVIATCSAVFLQVFSRIALIPDPGRHLLASATDQLRPGNGRSALHRARQRGAGSRLGHVWQAVPDEDFAATIQARAAQLYRLAKQAPRQRLDNWLAEQFALEAELQGEAGRTGDFKGGLGAQSRIVR
jgi:2-(1,2-epoxy-1,2-dihydrophenyl)acetyl-CoA isomerase